MIVDLTQLVQALGGLQAPRRPAPKAASSGVAVGYESDGTPVFWPRAVQSAAGHALVLAASGAGKTVSVADVLAREILEQEKLPAPLRPSLIVLDPKGDLSRHLVQAIGATTPRALSRLTVLNPFSPAGFTFNLNLARSSVSIEIRAMQLAHLVAEVSTGIGGSKTGMGARQVDVLQHVLLGALAVPVAGSSPLLALDALIERDGFSALAGITTSDRARQFLENTKLAPELQSSTSSRLRMALAATDELERLIAAPSCIDVAALVGPGQVVVIDLGAPPGGLGPLITFWANLLLRQFVDHLRARPSPWRGHTTRLVVDEAHIVSPVLSDVAEELLTTGRSRGISLVTMTQTLSLLQRSSAELVRCLEANVPFKLAGRLAPADAELLARGIGITGVVRDRLVQVLTNLEDRHFVCLQPRMVSQLKTCDVRIQAWNNVDRRHADEIEAAKTRFRVPPATRQRVQLRDLVRDSAGGIGQAMHAQSARGPRSKWG